MHIETHAVEECDVTRVPEPVLKDVEAWIVTAIDLRTRKPCIEFFRKEKGLPIPFESQEQACHRAKLLAGDTVRNTKTARFAFIRVQKLFVV